MEKYAVIVAGGEGTRIGGALPKQFRDIDGRPMLWWSLKAFHDEDPSTRLRVVLHPGFFDDWDLMIKALPTDEQFEHEVICGGRSRTESVMNGINGIPATSDALIAIHDAARPLVTTDMISRGWMAALTAGGAVPVVPVTDSLRRLTEDGSVAVNRDDFAVVQTPQVFRSDLLKAAYGKVPPGIYSDDATVFEAAGMKPALYEGSPRNMKVTNPGDLEIAALMLRDK